MMTMQKRVMTMNTKNMVTNILRMSTMTVNTKTKNFLNNKQAECKKAGL
jgi:hypothetical protein